MGTIPLRYRYLCGGAALAMGFGLMAGQPVTAASLVLGASAIPAAAEDSSLVTEVAARGGGRGGRVGAGRVGVGRVGWGGRAAAWRGRPGLARAAVWGGRPGLRRAAWWGGAPGWRRAAWWGGAPGWRLRRAAWWGAPLAFGAAAYGSSCYQWDPYYGQYVNACYSSYGSYASYGGFGGYGLGWGWAGGPGLARAAWWGGRRGFGGLW